MQKIHNYGKIKGIKLFYPVFNIEISTSKKIFSGGTKMFGLFRKKAKKVEVEPKKKVFHDKYEVYRLMRPEDLEAEAQNKEAEANELAKKWGNMTESERDENLDMYYEAWNLRREARFFRELKSDPDTEAPELFELLSEKPAHGIQALIWNIKIVKEKK